MKKNRMKISDFNERVQAQIRNQIAGSRAFMESHSFVEAERPHAVETLDAPYYISVRCKTKNAMRSDPDNICIKWILDELVNQRILSNDTSKEIKRISFTREKGEPDETIITVWEL